MWKYPHPCLNNRQLVTNLASSIYGSSYLSPGLFGSKSQKYIISFIIFQHVRLKDRARAHLFLKLLERISKLPAKKFWNNFHSHQQHRNVAISPHFCQPQVYTSVSSKVTGERTQTLQAKADSPAEVIKDGKPVTMILEKLKWQIQDLVRQPNSQKLPLAALELEREGGSQSGQSAGARAPGWSWDPGGRNPLGATEVTVAARNATRNRERECPGFFPPSAPLANPNLKPVGTGVRKMSWLQHPLAPPLPNTKQVGRSWGMDLRANRPIESTLALPLWFSFVNEYERWAQKISPSHEGKV